MCKVSTDIKGEPSGGMMRLCQVSPIPTSSYKTGQSICEDIFPNRGHHTKWSVILERRGTHKASSPLWLHGLGHSPNWHRKERSLGQGNSLALRELFRGRCWEEEAPGTHTRILQKAPQSLSRILSCKHTGQDSARPSRKQLLGG